MAQNWFKHDYSARNDEKILELRAEYGWKGYGLFFGLVESMCETETGCIDTERIGGLSVGYGLPKDELLTFIEFCLDIELFYEDEEGLIKNKRVIEHLEHMNTLKEAGKKGAQKRWNKQKNRGANGVANDSPNADKIREDKIKEDNTTSLSVSTNVHDVPNASDYETWESSIKVANYLLESICQYDTTHKYNHNEPSLDRWVKDIDRAIRLDGRTEDQLMYLINYIYRQNGKHSSFWAGNIESGAKLREQFDKIKNQIKSEKTNGRTHGNYNEKLAETEKFLDQYYSESN